MWCAALLLGGVIICDILDVAAAFSVDVLGRSQITSSSLKFDNCIVANNTYIHNETFKLDCKTQCVCENGRHACSSLCPKEMLTPPKDTKLCRSPRLVEMSDQCCKVWQCDKPSEDVNVTCHNTSISPWTQCSETCGIGLSKRETKTMHGCQKLASLRLCQNRHCAIIDSDAENRIRGRMTKHQDELMLAHKTRSGHDCRNIYRMSASRVRLGPCVSRQLYRPKMCGLCQSPSKCCVPSSSATIQVEMLCPINTGDPLNFMETTRDLWNSDLIEPIDEERLHAQRIPVENHFINVEWVLKCECSHRGKSCQEAAFGRSGPSITRDEVNDYDTDDEEGQIKQTFNSIQTNNKLSFYETDSSDDTNNVGNYANNGDIGNEREEDHGFDVDRIDLLKRVHRT